MSKTYRSLFLTCGACRSGVESDVKYCKHCGKAIWLKDSSDAPAPIPSPTEALKQNLESEVDPVEESLQIAKLQQDLANLHRAKLQEELGRWLPIIFPNYYYVAPNPMLKQTLDFLVQHMGKELIYNMNILGSGFDSMNNRVYVFSDDSMYYKSLGNDGVLYKISYFSIKEIEAGNGKITIRTDSVGTKDFLAFHEVALAEMLSIITGANIKLFGSTGTIKKDAGGNSTVANGNRPGIMNPSGVPKPSGITEPSGSQSLSGNNQPAGASVQKTYYTIKDYVREHTNAFMLLIMLGTRVCLGIQCGVSCSYGNEAIILGIIFAVFALAIGYNRPWIMVGCWFYCAVVSDDPSIGTGLNQGEWWGAAVTFLSVALVCRFILWIKYKNYMAQVKK